MPNAIDSSNERRTETRVYCAFPSYIRGILKTRRRFKLHMPIDNISRGGLYLQLPDNQLGGETLFIFVKLPNGAGIALNGLIVRVDKKQHGFIGAAVRFKRWRIIAARQV